MCYKLSKPVCNSSVTDQLLGISTYNLARYRCYLISPYSYPSAFRRSFITSKFNK